MQERETTKNEKKSSKTDKNRQKRSKKATTSKRLVRKAHQPPLSRLQSLLLIVVLKAVSGTEADNHEEFYRVASSAGYKLMKTFSLSISQTILKQEHIKTMWYADYLQVRNKSEVKSPKTGLFDPFLSIITVMQRGVYFKRFEKTWRLLNPRAEENTQMTKLFELAGSTNITAAYIPRNGSLVAVAYSNLTVEIFDLRFVKKRESEDFYTFESILVDSGYRYGREGDHEVLAIARIPNSDFLVFSSNRFEILKIDLKTGLNDANSPRKNPLEKIRYLETPSKSHRADLDPFNPTSQKSPETNKIVFQRAHKPHLIATGASDPMNAVIDWTTMTAVRFFSLHLLEAPGITREDDIVGSITYYGGIPQGHLYCITKIGLSPLLTLYSGIYSRDLINYNLGTPSRNRVVNWIYGTVFVSLYYPHPISELGRPIMKVIAPYGGRLASQANVRIENLVTQQVGSFEMAQLFLQLGKSDKEEKFYMEKFYELDSLYLAIFNKSNSIRVEPPAIGWDHCWEREGAEKAGVLGEMGYMFYGRLMLCPLPKKALSSDAGGGASDTGGGGGAESTQSQKSAVDGFCSHGLQQIHFQEHQQLQQGSLGPLMQSNYTLINCRDSPCPEGQVPHYIPPKSLLITRDTFLEEKTVCVPEYIMNDDRISVVANNNGCSSWFNKNPFGVCHACVFLSSDCLLFIKEFAESYNFDIYGYESSKANQTVIYKDFRIRSLQGKTTTEQIFETLQSNLVSFHNDFTMWRYQNKPLSVPCYQLRGDYSNKFDYIVSARGEYTLVNASRQGYDISKQVAEIGNGSLTELVCIKPCPVGEFYEFESLSCRKCNLGCGVCKSFENCTRCIPGFNKIQDSKSHKDIQEGYPVGFCRPGCQPGFHPIRFNGECRECTPECLVCRDKTAKEMFLSAEIGIKNKIYCTRCRGKVSDGGKVLYANLSTGECVDHCEGFGVFKDRLNSSTTDQKDFLVCGRCFDPNCENCGKDDSEKACVACRGGYRLQRDGRCRFFWKTSEGALVISLVVVGGVVSLGLLLGLSCCVFLRNSGRNRAESLRRASMYLGGIEGIDGQEDDVLEQIQGSEVEFGGQVEECESLNDKKQASSHFKKSDENSEISEEVGSEKLAEIDSSSKKLRNEEIQSHLSPKDRPDESSLLGFTKSEMSRQMERMSMLGARKSYKLKNSGIELISTKNQKYAKNAKDKDHKDVKS